MVNASRDTYSTFGTFKANNNNNGINTFIVNTVNKCLGTSKYTLQGDTTNSSVYLKYYDYNATISQKNTLGTNNIINSQIEVFVIMADTPFPLQNTAISITGSDGSSRRLITDSNGLAYFNGTVNVTYSIGGSSLTVKSYSNPYIKLYTDSTVVPIGEKYKINAVLYDVNTTSQITSTTPIIPNTYIKIVGSDGSVYSGITNYSGIATFDVFNNSAKVVKYSIYGGNSNISIQYIIPQGPTGPQGLQGLAGSCDSISKKLMYKVIIGVIITLVLLLLFINYKLKKVIN
jgi:hypothetical protein